MFVTIWLVKLLAWSPDRRTEINSDNPSPPFSSSRARKHLGPGSKSKMAEKTALRVVSLNWKRRRKINVAPTYRKSELMSRFWWNLIAVFMRYFSWSAIVDIPDAMNALKLEHHSWHLHLHCFLRVINDRNCCFSYNFDYLLFHASFQLTAGMRENPETSGRVGSGIYFRNISHNARLSGYSRKSVFSRIPTN